MTRTFARTWRGYGRSETVFPWRGYVLWLVAPCSPCSVSQMR